MRAAPLRPSVELPMGPQSAVPGVANARGLRHWDLRTSSKRPFRAVLCAFGAGLGPPWAVVGPSSSCLLYTSPSPRDRSLS
eukprot:6454529-Pyramimonas_sp.AAC.1